MTSAKKNKKQIVMFEDRLKKNPQSLTLMHYSQPQTFNVPSSLSVEGINQDLYDFTSVLEEKPQNALACLKEVIRNVSNANRSWLQTWTDHMGFDILHLAIIKNRPDIINYLLDDEQLFPSKYKPRSNPYAHLAATLGYLDCLKEVLDHRPDDYFKTSEPRHIIKLPLSLLPRQTTSLSKAGHKNIDRLMRIVKEDTAIAEKAVDNTVNVQSDQAILENEVKKLQDSFKEKHSKPRRRYLSNSGYTTGSSASLRQPRNTPDRMAIRKPFKQQQKPFQRLKPLKPKISVYWDVFKDESEGVVKGAGVPVEVVHVDNNKVPHLGWSLERKDVVHYKKKKVLPKIHQKETHKAPVLEKTSQGRSKSFLNASHTSTMAMGHTSKSTPPHERIELGVRRIKKYKVFIPIFEPKRPAIDDPNKYYGKTPLTMAAEKGHGDCVIYLLETFYFKKTGFSCPKDPLTLATKARSPESLAVLLEGKFSRSDFQSAVLMSIRELYPDCLTVLLNLGSKERGQIFDGTNLFHILFSQSLIANYRYEMLPEMTRVLINSREEVNARTPFKTYPLYTLIQCAFNVNIGKTSFYYLECLKMLLDAKANPHFNEQKGESTQGEGALNLTRPSYTSAIQCIMVNAHFSLQYFEKSYWSQIILQKFIDAVASHDRTPRRVNNEILFTYMDYIAQLGLNRRILRILLRYGANPDHTIDGKYPLIVFFEASFSFLTKFQVQHKYVSNDDMLDTLLIFCKAMTPSCLRKAVLYFLDNHLLSAPLQALDITRKFCYHANKIINFPRPLSQIASQMIWLYLKRNSKLVRKLPVHEEIMQQIMP